MNFELLGRGKKKRDRWWNSKRFKSNNFRAFEKLPRFFGFYVYWEKSSLMDTRYILTFNKLHSSQNGGRHIEKSLLKTEWHEFLLRNNQSHGICYRHSLDSKIWRLSSELPSAPLLFPKAQGKNKAFDNVRPTVPKMNTECLLLITLRKRGKKLLWAYCPTSISDLPTIFINSRHRHPTNKISNTNKISKFPQYFYQKFAILLSMNSISNIKICYTRAENSMTNKITAILACPYFGPIDFSV